MNATTTLQCLFAVLLFLSIVESNSPKDQGCGGGSGVPGIPGAPGHNGLPGKDGLSGRDGLPGRDGLGQKGSHGIKGTKGDTGQKGATGKTGPKGNLGPIGQIGRKGEQGTKGNFGANGQMGMKGEKGENGTINSINWKQCVWRINDGKDAGLIQECVFKKRLSSTALKVAYAANMRVYCPGSRCCGRWYITFNGAECSGPMAIDGAVYMDGSKNNAHHHRHIEGFCENISSGSISVAVRVGNCEGHGSSDRYSGWRSVSRIMIEEYPQSQS